MDPAVAGGANRSAAEMSTQLWHCRFWLAATCRVTSVTNARPRWARKARISGSSRWNVCRTYAPCAEFQTTAGSDTIRLDSDP